MKNKIFPVFVFVSLIMFLLSFSVELTKNMPIGMAAKFFDIAFSPKRILIGLTSCLLMAGFIMRKIF